MLRLHAEKSHCPDIKCSVTSLWQANFGMFALQVVQVERQRKACTGTLLPGRDMYIGAETSNFAEGVLQKRKRRFQASHYQKTARIRDAPFRSLVRGNMSKERRDSRGKSQRNKTMFIVWNSGNVSKNICLQWRCCVTISQKGGGCARLQAGLRFETCPNQTRHTKGLGSCCLKLAATAEMKKAQAQQAWQDNEDH